MERNIFTTSELTGVNEQPTIPPKSAALMKLYPNPFNGVMHLQIDIPHSNKTQIGEIKIFDILGRNIYSQKVNLKPGNNDFLWHPTDLSSGMYFVHVSVGDTKLLSKIGYVK